MLISNMNNIPGKELEILSMVSSSTVHAKNFGKDLMAGLKNLVGGELSGYTEMVEDAKNHALQNLEKEAEKLGASAILNVSFTMTNMSQGSAIAVLASGTAVKFI